MLRQLIKKYSADFQPTREEVLEDLQNLLARIINRGTMTALRAGYARHDEMDGSFLLEVTDPTEYLVKVSQVEPTEALPHAGLKFELADKA